VDLFLDMPIFPANRATNQVTIIRGSFPLFIKPRSMGIPGS
jgi:hypothetical protein